MRESEGRIVPCKKREGEREEKEEVRETHSEEVEVGEMSTTSEKHRALFRFFLARSKFFPPSEKAASFQSFSTPLAAEKRPLCPPPGAPPPARGMVPPCRNLPARRTRCGEARAPPRGASKSSVVIARFFSCFLLPMAKRFLFLFSSSRSRALSPSPSLFLLLSARGMTLDTDELHPHEQKTQRKNQQQVLASSGAAAGTAAAAPSSSEAATAANFLHAAAAAAVSSSWASLVALPRK